MSPVEHAPAKLTWSLRVLGVRPDGFHEVEALTTVVTEPHDTVGLDASTDGITLTLSGIDREVPVDPTNLAWRAAAAAGFEVAIRLDKRIPAGAGLGGGSADAAAVLRGLRDGFALEATRAEAIAVALGSDVPVCLLGRTAWMRGRGERVEAVPPVPVVPVVIAVPPVLSSTPAVYAAWDALGGPSSTRTMQPPPAVAHLVGELANDLEPAAEHVDGRLAEFREAFAVASRRPPLLAGSGSAYWVWVADPDEARATATKVERELGVATFAGRAGVGVNDASINDASINDPVDGAASASS